MFDNRTIISEYFDAAYNVVKTGAKFGEHSDYFTQ
jgi:hypothetical protein